MKYNSHSPCCLPAAGLGLYPGRLSNVADVGRIRPLSPTDEWFSNCSSSSISLSTESMRVWRLRSGEPLEVRSLMSSLVLSEDVDNQRLGLTQPRGYNLGAGGILLGAGMGERGIMAVCCVVMLWSLS